MNIFTENQKSAIESNNKDIVVSAGAGSGKTTVLSERIINLLNDKSSPADLSEMLIITFTKASALDLKNKIFNRISKAVAENPDNTHLKRQLIKIPSADISTIDSFLSKTVRNNAHLLGINPSFSIAEESDIERLSLNAMDEAIEECFSVASFSTLVSSFVSAEDTDLSEKFLNQISSLKTRDISSETLKIIINEISGISYDNFFDSKYGRYVKTYLTKYYSSIEDKIIDLEKRYYTDTDFQIIEKNINDHKNFVFAVLKSLKDDYRSFNIQAEKISFKEQFSTKVNKSYNAYLVLKDLHNNIKDEFKKYTKNEDVFNEEIRKSYEYLNVLINVFSAFDSKMLSLKQKLNILEFSDLKTLTLKLLEQHDDIAENISTEYKYIFVDEYQDVDSVQQNIFDILQKHNSSFFRVGDIKQSIYGFRGAVPENFTSLKNKNSNEENDGETIYLSDNFRCDNNIIDFCNAVSSGTFIDGVLQNDNAYDPENEALIHSKTEDYSGPEVKPEIHIIKKDKEILNGEENYIADKIHELIRNGYNSSDICILLRNKTKLPTIKNALANYGISCSDSSVEDYLSFPEVHALISLLKTIDNTSDDISVTAVLMSPLFEMTLEELENISLSFDKDNNISLYNKLFQYNSDNYNPKLDSFFSKIEEYRLFELGKNSTELINYIFADSFIREIYGKDSYDRLNILRDISAEYEKSSYKGLYKFLSYIEKYKFNTKSVPVSDSSVNIRTIHSAKGLEYRVIILADVFHLFSSKEISNNFIYSDKIGCGFLYPDNTGYGKCENILHDSVCLAVKNTEMEEEWRLLYVALTRAKEKLIITGSPNLRSKKYTDEFDNTFDKYNSVIINYYDYITNGNFFCGILFSLIKSGFSGYTMDIISSFKPGENDNHDISVPKAENTLSINSELLNEKLNYKYPYASASINIPVKLSVSKMYPSILDDLENDEAGIYKTEDFRKPVFIDKRDASAADKGTAMHVFMQFCDFSGLKEKGVDYEIERLLNGGFINEKIKDLLEKDKIEKFVSSEIFNKALKSSEIKREVNFTLNMDASELSENPEVKDMVFGEKFIVQGVIDCIYFDADGKMTVIDYKTDKLTGDIDSFKQILLQRHSTQLNYYKKAANLMYGRSDTCAFIYSFSINDYIEVV